MKELKVDLNKLSTEQLEAYLMLVKADTKPKSVLKEPVMGKLEEPVMPKFDPPTETDNTEEKPVKRLLGLLF